jgi:hypothetical protein
MYQEMLAHKPHTNMNCEEHSCIYFYKLIDVPTHLYNWKFR